MGKKGKRRHSSVARSTDKAELTAKKTCISGVTVDNEQASSQCSTVDDSKDAQCSQQGTQITDADGRRQASETHSTLSQADNDNAEEKMTETRPSVEELTDGANEPKVEATKKDIEGGSDNAEASTGLAAAEETCAGQIQHEVSLSDDKVTPRSLQGHHDSAVKERCPNENTAATEKSVESSTCDSPKTSANESVEVSLPMCHDEDKRGTESHENPVSNLQYKEKDGSAGTAKQGSESKENEVAVDTANFENTDEFSNENKLELTATSGLTAKFTEKPNNNSSDAVKGEEKSDRQSEKETNKSRENSQEKQGFQKMKTENMNSEKSVQAEMNSEKSVQAAMNSERSFQEINSNKSVQGQQEMSADQTLSPAVRACLEDLDGSAFDMDVTESQLCAVTDDILEDMEEEKECVEEAGESQEERRKRQKEDDRTVRSIIGDLLRVNEVLDKMRSEMETFRRQFLRALSTGRRQ